MDALCLLTLHVNLNDYPSYAACARANAYLGLSLCEYYAATGMRYTVPLGYAASMIYFYLYHRPRLSFADRALAKLHHYFFPSAAYTTPLGIIGGIAYGSHQCVQELSPSALKIKAAREEEDAMMAASQYAEHRRAASAHLEAEQRAFTKALVWLRLRDNPALADLTRMGLEECTVKWESLLVPHGFLWTQLHSVVHDAALYKDYDGPVVSNSVTPHAPTHSKTSASTGSRGEGGVEARSPPFAGVLSAPFFAAKLSAHFTKPQVDAVVSQLATRRASSEEDRWMRSAGRCGCYGMIGALLTWNSGCAVYRALLGLGLGVTVGATLSGARLDQAFTHV